LAHYLKALGILRLVAEQADPAAAGCWQRDVFTLHSRLDRYALLNFFLNDYRPTPILAPWNGGSGFYFQEEKLKEKDPLTGKRKKTGRRTQPTEATRVIDALATTTDPRFCQYRAAILLTREVLAGRELEEAPKGAAKDELLIELRNRWPDAAVQWLDCVLVLTSDRNKSHSPTGLVPAYTPMLGSGANDGNADFSSNFMQRLIEVLLNRTNLETGLSQRWLKVSLFGENHPQSRIEALAGQFEPGFAGGPNSVSGFKGRFSVNPWDFVFLIEGTLFFAAAVVKGHQTPGQSGLAYPFSVRAAGVGYPSAGAADELADKSSTEELWMPLWSRAANKAELLTVLSEGRAQIGSAAAQTGVDFARAICANGTDRGFDEFVRYGLLIRRGDSTSATPLGRFRVKRNACADLLSDADRWLDNFRRIAGPANDQVPAVITRAVNQLENRIIDLCQDGTPQRLQAVLVALGQAERALARSFAWTTGRNDKPPRQKIAPLAGLSDRWLRDADDGSIEFRLAAALASVNGIYRDTEGRPTPLPLRCHLEPVVLRAAQDPRWFDWDDQPSNDVVWHEGDLVNVLNAIFGRRLLSARQAGHSVLPDTAVCFAPLADVVAFLEGQTDDGRLADLLWGLSLVDWSRARSSALQSDFLEGARHEQSQSVPDPTPEATPPAIYSLLRLAFPRHVECSDFPEIPIVAAIHQHAAHGNGSAASRLAARRLRASDLPPALETVCVKGVAARRAAAALLFPLSRADFARLRELVLKPRTVSV